MKNDLITQVSVLACVTGLLLVAAMFVSAWLGLPQPEWLPMVIASIAGFEMFMVFQAIRDRRAGDGTNG